MESGYFHRIASGIIIGVFLSLIVGVSKAAPKSELWPRWAAHDPASTAVIDHARWTEFLGHHVKRFPDGISRLRYEMVTSADRAALEHYIDRLVSLPISSYNRNQQRGYWINLYNALTVKLVLAHYPVSSIRDINISPSLFSRGPWDKKLVRIEGVELSLNDIEHRILRPVWRDPRIHYVVNCASLGCPNLIPVAFSADNADALLDKGAATYINHPRGVSTNGNELVTSSIYVWFKEDFGGSDADVIDHLRKYADPQLKAELMRFSRIGGHDYDWSLNSVR